MNDVTYPGKVEDRRLVESLIRVIPNHPIPNIMFKDIMPVMNDPRALSAAVRLHLDCLRQLPAAPIAFNKVLGIESRGFLFGPMIALSAGAGFICARKPGKLPGPVVSASYDLEYGSNTIAVQVDAIKPGDRVVVIDDLLATGGTMEAACRLVEQMGGTVVTCLCLIELAFLGARDGKLAGRRIDTVYSY